MNTTMEHLDVLAADYHMNESIPDIHIENLCQDYFIQWLTRQIPGGGSVLELGYGDGLVTAALAKERCQLTVIEGSKTLVDRARSKHPDTDFIHTLFEEFRPSVPYDLVLASHVLEHVDDPRAILRLLSMWLRDSGRIIAVVPNCNSLHRQLAVLMGLQPSLESLSKRDLLVGHQRVYSLKTLEEDVISAGLSVVASCGFFLKVLPNSMMLDYSRELLWGLNAISGNLPKELLANIAVIVTKNTVA